MTLNEQQTKRANKLLKALCESDFINGENVYPFFDSEKEAVYVCSVLADRQLLTANWYENDKITGLIANENTRNAVETNLLVNELSKQAKADSKEQLDAEIAKLTVLNLQLQNRQLKTKMLFSIIGFMLGVIATNWKEILTVLKIISPAETK